MAANPNESIVRLDLVFGEFYRSFLFSQVPAYQDHRSLTRYGFKIYSQNDEDGILAEIFRRIGTTNRYFVEFGVGNGVENNTLALLVQGWTGGWIEADANNANVIRQLLARYLAAGKLKTLNSFITAENINALFAELGVPVEFDLMSMDIDFNDYHVWRALTGYRPRVIVLEYNAGFGPSMEWTIAYDPTTAWDGSRYFGASLKSYELLGREKGYALVGCNLTGTNAFFVRQDLLAGHFLAPYTAEQHFESPKYHLRFPQSHPVSAHELLKRPVAP